MFRKKKNDNVYEEPNQRIKQVKAKAKGLAGGIIGVFVVLYLLNYQSRLHLEKVLTY